MAPPPLRVDYATVEALSTDVEQNLRHGRAFIPGVEPRTLRERCVVVLVHPANGGELELPAEVVWVEEGVGVGVDMGPVDVARLRSFVVEPPAPPELEVVEDDPGAASPAPTPEASAGEAASGGDDTAAGEARAAARAADEEERRSTSLYERVRRLSARDRDAIAKSGALPERVALERCFQGAVWELLLQNPQITPPEVARIARNGGVPRPIMAMIVANAGWVSVPEVQRALLTNPRLDGQHIERVLRALSSSDLRRVAQQTAYRTQVRQAAAKLTAR